MDPNLPYSAQPIATNVTPPPAAPMSSNNKLNFGFGVAIILYQILTLPIYGVLFRLSGSFELQKDYGGVLLMSITTILLVIGFGLINSYVIRSSLTGLTFTLVIFALSIQHWFLFRAFWNKAGTNDYINSEKNWGTWYDSVTLSNYAVDRQTTTLLPSGPFVQAIACALAMVVAFNALVGRIGLLQIFIMTLFGSFFYEVNAQLIYRWFITDNGFGCRVLLFGSIMGAVIAFLLGRKQTTVQHPYYRSQYRIMGFALLGFLFLCVSLPMLSSISVFSRTTPDNAILYAAALNSWLAVMAGVLGTFTASSFVYRKFSLHDLVFCGSAGAFGLSMQADINFNPTVPLIVGYVVGLASSLYASSVNRYINKNGVLFTYSHINRFLTPAFFGCIVSAIVQACNRTQNGAHFANRLAGRTAIQQGGWQIIGFLITAGAAIIAGLIAGIIIKILNKNTVQDQFNDQNTYSHLPRIQYYVY